LAVPVETRLVVTFAALLGVGSVAALFVPVFRRAVDAATGRFGLLLIGSAMGLAMILSAALVVLATSDPVLVTPIVGTIVVLRVASPPLLYWRLREALDTRRGWVAVRPLVLLSFLLLAALLLGQLLGVPGGDVSVVVRVSDQLLMATGATILFVRFAFRARPREAREWWPAWIGAILFGVAFLLVAPYAFPGFAPAYIASGIAGWAVGAVVAHLDR
jgi:hypothetical protein